MQYDVFGQKAVLIGLTCVGDVISSIYQDSVVANKL